MWHRHPDSSDDATVPESWPVTITRDDLIRLVRQAVDECADLPITDKEAADIVDEWLGVR